MAFDGAGSVPAGDSEGVSQARLATFNLDPLAYRSGFLNDAKKGWQDGNVDAPELVNLKHLLSAIE